MPTEQAYGLIQQMVLSKFEGDVLDESQELTVNEIITSLCEGYEGLLSAEINS